MMKFEIEDRIGARRKECGRIALRVGTASREGKTDRGPGGRTLVLRRPTVTLSGPSIRYDKERLSEKIGTPLDLAGGHLLSHVKQETTVAFFNATHQPAELAQQTCLFP